MKEIKLSRNELFAVIKEYAYILSDLEDDVEKNIAEGRQDDNYNLFDLIAYYERRYKELCKIYDEWK